jgi:hypothetical protein
VENPRAYSCGPAEAQKERGWVGIRGDDEADKERETRRLAIDVRAELPTGRAVGDLYGNAQEEDSVRARWLIESGNKPLVLLETQSRLLARVLEGEIGTYPFFATAMRTASGGMAFQWRWALAGLYAVGGVGFGGTRGSGFHGPVRERGWASRIWSGSSLKIE